MRRAAIVSPIRTAVGKYMGALSNTPAGDLGAVALRDQGITVTLVGDDKQLSAIGPSGLFHLPRGQKCGRFAQ